MTLQKSVLLKHKSNFNIGGIAKYYFDFKNKIELTDAIEEYKKIDLNLEYVFVLGGGTNVLINDNGYDGLVLKDSINSINYEGNFIVVSSGVMMDELTRFAIDNSLSGFEWAGGLPGAVGGAIRGNAGAFGGEIKDNLVEVESIGLDSQKSIKRNNSECNFDYRKSIFKIGEGKDEVILKAKFKVLKGDKNEIETKTKEKIDYRRAHHPIELPNLGSIFKNIPVENVPKDILEEYGNSIKHDPFPVLPVAKLISSAGLKGKRVGNAEISTKHPNFIVNVGNASSKDVLDLIQIVKNLFIEKYKISLEEEITIL